MATLERISLEVTNRCHKACPFCYNRSHVGGTSGWTPDEVVSLVTDCAAHGVKAVSFGGGEPLEFPAIIEVIDRLRGVLFRSVTTNGLPLTPGFLDRLANAAPEKVHVSLHHSTDEQELQRVLNQVDVLSSRGIRSGVNLLVRRSQLSSARRAAARLRAAGIDNRRILYLPMRGSDTPTPAELAQVAGQGAFQSSSCLVCCGSRERFCSIGWDKRVAWCSYTTGRRPLSDLNYRGLVKALAGLEVVPCGEPFDRRLSGQVRGTPLGDGRSGKFRAAPTVDYPAGHSVDTEWFAVDADGYVAIFDTGEMGEPPVEPRTMEQLEQAGEEARALSNLLRESPFLSSGTPSVRSATWPTCRLVQSDPAPDVVFDELLWARIYRPDNPWIRDNFGHLEGPAEWQREPDSVFALLKSLEPIRGLLQEGRAKVLPSFPTSAGWPVLFPRFDAVACQAIHATDQCLVCALLVPRDVIGTDTDMATVETLVLDAFLGRSSYSLARCGIYSYTYYENWYPYHALHDTQLVLPYLREVLLPRVPLRVDELPSSLRSVIEHTRLGNVRFANDRIVQPAKTVRVRYRDRGYLDVDFRTTGPLIGFEASYDAQQVRAELANLEPEYVPWLPAGEDTPGTPTGDGQPGQGP
jgi:hypothetical protein